MMHDVTHCVSISFRVSAALKVGPKAGLSKRPHILGREFMMAFVTAQGGDEFARTGDSEEPLNLCSIALQGLFYF
jgi:hypothetical protein